MLQSCKNGKKFANIQLDFFLVFMATMNIKGQNINEAFKQILDMSTIDQKRQKYLVPYSLSHYQITLEIKYRNNFDALSVQYGTNI